MLHDHHDYSLAEKEWKSEEKEFANLKRCHYCKIPLITAEKIYQRPTFYDDNYDKFNFMPGRIYGHPACILTEITEQPYIHFLRATFLLHKYLRMIYGYYNTLVKAPPREILPSFLGPLPFAHFGEIIATQRVVCEHIYAPFYIPDMSLPLSPPIETVTEKTEKIERKIE